MKKQKKIFVQIIFFIAILLSSGQVFATDFSDYLGDLTFSEDYQNYLNLSDEEKENVMMPRMYDIPLTKKRVTNPLRLTRMLGSSLTSKYSLRDIIPQNIVIKNQQSTNSCWAFSSLAMLETTLALKDYKYNDMPIVYDFSERHMEYATSRTFKDNVINEIGFNRDVGMGGNSYLYIPYLTNGTGAISEADMPFENNEDSIYISEIQNKEVITQINDMVIFPLYSSADELTQLKQQMKEHIKNYGAIDAGIYGASIDANSLVYNNETGAIYCNDSSEYPINHAVAIIGWDDNYSVENFVESNRPTNNGAWIIKNSWGTGMEYTLEEMKEYIFEKFPNDCTENGWTNASEIPDELTIKNFESWGYTVENNIATLEIGDDGFMYVSYEDVNIYNELTGIIDAQIGQTYENLYQYDQYGGVVPMSLQTSKVYLATVFDKKTTLNEYLTQVSVYASETYTCKVYVNPNGESKSMSDLQEVQLKSGKTETFDAGYHTIEFLNPIKINSDKFVVVLEIQGTVTDSMSVMIEFKYSEFFGDDESIGYIFDNVQIESGKCFMAAGDSLANNEWIDTSTIYTISNGNMPDFDTTIKAFTTSKVLENITVTTPPIKTSYIEGENFDSKGMVVKGKYGDGTLKEITDYIITGGTNLQPGQTSVTISYKDKTTTQSITVLENVVESIEITTPPTKTEYWAGESFDLTGLVVQATYTDGTIKAITDFVIKNGATLQNGQTSVTIEYAGKTAKQAITVKTNSVVEIKITKAPNKGKYIAGQNFDSTGMVVKAIYENGLEKEVTDYIIQNGTNLQVNQTSVTIEFGGQIAKQAIKVEEKSITGISVKILPTKTEYIQNIEDLDLTDGVIKISYNDNTYEDMAMDSKGITVKGFDNKVLGTKTIVLIYQEHTTNFEVKVIEPEKPELSDFKNMQGNVKELKGYSYTDVTKQEYIVFNVELSNIIKATENDNVEYYYYISGNQLESDIVDWVKIKKYQKTDNGFVFEINTLDISNYEEVIDAENLCIYIKEVATKNNITAEEVVSTVLLIDDDVNVEIYIDGEKIENIYSSDGTPGESPDSSLSPDIIPNAGKSALILFVAFAIFIIGRIAYARYKDIELK